MHESMGMAILGMSEFRNPWTDWLEIDMHDYAGDGDCPSYAKSRKIWPGVGFPSICQYSECTPCMRVAYFIKPGSDY